MNGFDFIIQLIWLLMVVVGSVLIIVGFVLIIEMIAGLYYIKSYLNDLEGCKRDLIKTDEEEAIIVEYEDDKLIEAIKLVRRERIIKGLLGVIFIVGGFIALFM